MDLIPDFSKNPFIVYCSGTHRDGICMNLIAFGIKYFMQTGLYHKQLELKEECTLFSKDRMPDISKLNFLIVNSLIDSIKISIAFESFLKAILLQNGVIIHTIQSAEEFKNMRKAQKKRPITKSELTAVCDFKIKDGIIKSLALTEHTVSLSTMLSYEDQGQYRPTPNLMKTIKDYSEERNKLHFLESQSFNLTKYTYANFKEMILFINEAMIPKLNHLIEILPGTEKQTHGLI